VGTGGVILLSDQETAGICHFVRAVVVSKIVLLAYFQHQNAVGFHGRNHSVGEAAGLIGIGAVGTDFAAACAQTQHFLPAFPEGDYNTLVYHFEETPL
jgi:hypothetical protein